MAFDNWIHHPVPIYISSYNMLRKTEYFINWFFVSMTRDSGDMASKSHVTATEWIMNLRKSHVYIWIYRPMPVKTPGTSEFLPWMFRNYPVNKQFGSAFILVQCCQALQELASRYWAHHIVHAGVGRINRLSETKPFSQVTKRLLQMNYDNFWPWYPLHFRLLIATMTFSFSLRSYVIT
jgi:hypothetical protein